MNSFLSQAAAFETSPLRTQAFIDGQYRSALSGETFATINPANGKVIAHISACGVEDVNLAVTAARRAFESGVWRDQTPRQRKVVLQRFADLIDAHADELALLETLDIGKPIRDSRTMDIPKSANLIRWYAEALDKQYGEVAPTPHDTLAIITREPLGVVGAIVAWNFPLYLAAYKLGPALASGNSVILKPAEQSPLTALRVASLATEAGLPDGVLNVTPGLGAVTGAAIGLHMDIDCVSFTGSTATSRKLFSYAANSNLKRVHVEAGGKSPNIVLADARDLDEVARQAAWGIFFNQGQVCSAGSRLIIERGIEDRLLGAICDVARSMRVGDPTHPDTDIGAIVSEQQLDSILGHIEVGKVEGAQLILGGRRVLPDSGGYFLEPTIFAGVSNSMRIAREEIFGPVLSAILVEDLEEAISVANDTIYGLGAAIWTADIDRALSSAKALRAGQVWVNNYDGADYTVPWGGFKQSGNGRDKSLHAFDEYTGLKSTWIQLHKGKVQ